MFPNLSKAYPMNEVRMFQQRQLSQRRQMSQLSQSRNVTELNGFIPTMSQLSQVLHNASWQGARTIFAVSLCPDERSISPSWARTSHRPYSAPNRSPRRPE